MLTLVLSSLYSLAFYLIFGRGWLRLVFYWLVGVTGFFLGQWFAGIMGLAIFNIGDVNVVEGTLASWLSLLIAHAWRRAG